MSAGRVRIEKCCRGMDLECGEKLAHACAYFDVVSNSPEEKIGCTGRFAAASGPSGVMTLAWFGD